MTVDGIRDIFRDAVRVRSTSRCANMQCSSSSSGGGGVDFTSAASSFDHELPTPPLARFILYERIEPRTHDATIFHREEEHNCTAVSEVATYGAYLSTASRAPPLVDAFAGVGARTRPQDSSHPLAAALGYGAIGAVLAV